MPLPHRNDFLFFIAVPLTMLVGCNSTDQPTSATVEKESPAANAESNDSLADSGISVPALTTSQPAGYVFETPFRIQAGGEPIFVEEPGFACPTIYDLDGDGKDDLIVGQFNDGKMKWYRNLADAKHVPEYATGQWIQSGDEPAEVPGVS